MKFVVCLLGVLLYGCSQPHADAVRPQPERDFAGCKMEALKTFPGEITKPLSENEGTAAFVEYCMEAKGYSYNPKHAGCLDTGRTSAGGDTQTMFKSCYDPPKP